MPNVPSHWRHRAAQTMTTLRGIVHAYRGTTRAMIVRFEQRHGDMLNDDLFAWARTSIAVIDAAWLLDLPLSE